MQHQKRKILKVLWIVMLFVLHSPWFVMADVCSRYDNETATVRIPSVKVGETYLWLDIQLAGTNPLLFRLTDYGDAESKTARANFNMETYKLSIPCLDLESSRTYGADLHLIAGESDRFIDFILEAIEANTGSLVINEIVAKDADGGNDWIELFVTGANSVNLGNYTLVDEDADHDKATLPTITLNPGAYVVIQATDELRYDFSEQRYQAYRHDFYI